MFEMRREINGRTYENYREEECNKKGEVKGKLTTEEKDGLQKLQNSIREGEIVI